MLLTAYTLGLDKKLLRQGFQNVEQPQPSEGMGIVEILTMIMGIAVGVAAGYLSYTLNKHVGTSTGWMIFYVAIATIFSELYIVAYAFVYNPLLKNGASKSRSPASANRRNNI